MNEPQPVVNRTLLFLLCGGLLFLVGYAIRHTVSSFLFSLVVAYLLDPGVTFFERRNVRRVYGILVLYVILGIVSLFCLAYLIPFLTLRWESLLHDLPHHIQKIKEIAAGWESSNHPVYGGEEWRWLVDSVVGRLDALVGKVGGGMYAVAGRMAFNLFNVILAPILVFFMLYYKEAMLTGTIAMVPVRWRPAVAAVGGEINESIGGYLRGQLLVSFIVAVLSTAALFLLDVDYPVLNGIFAGLASILPFIGVILATLPPLFFAFIKFQNMLILLNVAAAFSVIYFLEGYLVKPLVFKRSMDLNPLVTIIAVMAFGELLGFWGILLAIPIMAAVKIIINHLRHGDFAVGQHGHD